MGVKKKKEESTKLVSKILIVGVCVLFVGLMILSGMGTSWLTILIIPFLMLPENPL
jgi:predicted histidine transporter YuiF (NhaC family)